MSGEPTDIPLSNHLSRSIVRHPLPRSVVPWLAAVLITGTALPAASQQSDLEPEPLVTDRPDFTESAVTVAPGKVQLESGYTFTRVDTEQEHTLGEVLLRVGVAERVEVRLGVNSFAFTRTPGDTDSGLEDASLGVKVRLADTPERFRLTRPGIALLAGTTLPTGGGAFGESTLQPEATLALAWPVSERIGLASNVGYAYASEGGDRFNQFSGSVTLAYALAERLGSYVEAYGFALDRGDGPDTGFVNGGLTYLLTNDLQFDVRAGVGLNAVEPDYFAGLGFARRW